MTLATSVPTLFAGVRSHFDNDESRAFRSDRLMYNGVMKALAIILEPESNRGR
jgi:hypothetical protein